jgi:cytochrome c peroxidase
MHDGRFAKLEDVIDFFSDGVKNSPNISSAFSLHPTSSGNGGYYTGGQVVHPKLTANEKADLLSFLQTFTDASITNDVRFSDPFKH